MLLRGILRPAVRNLIKSVPLTQSTHMSCPVFCEQMLCMPYITLFYVPSSSSTVCSKKNEYVDCPTTPKKQRLFVSPSPPRDQCDSVYHLHETQITQGKYFVRGGKLCHVVLEWREEGGEAEGEEGGCKEVAVVGDFTDGKQVPLERVR